MRIGIFFGQLSNGGGAYQLIHLARELMRQGHDVQIITYFSPEPAFFQEWLTGLSIHACVSQHKPTGRFECQPIGLIRYVTELWIMTYRMASMANRFQFDILHPHEWPFHWAAVLCGLRHRNTRIVWMCNDVWQVPGHEETPEKRWLFKWTHRLLIVPIDRLATRRVNVITVLDHRIKRIVEQYYHHAAVKVVRSGIDLEPYRSPVSRQKARQLLHLPQGDWLWLCLSIFHPHRCFEDVIQALAQQTSPGSNTSKLLLVGSAVNAPTYAADLKQLTQTLALDERVMFINKYVTLKEKLLYLAAADGFIFSNDHQTWGLAVIEAMAAGLPCIVSSGAGVSEIIQDGQNGLIFQRRRVDDLARQMNVMMINPSLCKQLAITGKEYVFATYSWTAYARQMEHFFSNWHRI